MLTGFDVMTLLIAFVSAAALLVLMTPFAHQLGLVDHATARKQHVGNIPLTGGVAIYGGVLIASILTDVWFKNSSWFLTASFLIVLLGMMDDKFDLSAKGRLLCQFIVAAIMAWAAQNYITSLGNIFGTGDVNLGIVGYGFTLVCVVGVINAFNMIDGIDGLAGGICLVILLCVVMLLTLANNTNAIMAPMMIVATLIPFLAFNLSIKGFKGNKIYMGDSGSMFVGLAVVWLMVDFTQGAEPALRPITAVWILGLPLLDMAAIMYRRAKKGQSVLRPDRQHLHFICMRAGLSSRQSLILLLFIGFTFALIGIVGEIYNVPEYVMFWSFIVLIGVYSLVLQRIWVILRFVRDNVRLLR